MSVYTFNALVFHNHKQLLNELGSKLFVLFNHCCEKVLNSPPPPRASGVEKGSAEFFSYLIFQDAKFYEF